MKNKNSIRIYQNINNKSNIIAMHPTVNNNYINSYLNLCNRRED